MATAKKTEGAKASYEVTSPLEHDGDRYEVGSTVELTPAQAEPLLGNTVKPKAGPAAGTAGG